MKEETITDALLREFLLGNANDEERGRIESLFLTDAQVREKVLALEQELVEAYLEDSLDDKDKERFLSIYAQTDEQRRNLRITKSIKDWAVKEAGTSQATAVTVPVWSRLWTRLRLKPVFVVPIAVAIVIAVVLAIGWFNNRMEQRKHLAVEQELVELNSPASLREVAPQTIFLNLKPVAVRSGEPQTELRAGADTRFIELRLAWIQKERFSTYRAELRRGDESESFTIPNVQAENDGRSLIRIRLSTQMLRRGRYEIQLRGIANNGSLSPAEEYTFTVAG
jgi:hypothetical protein